MTLFKFFMGETQADYGKGIAVSLSLVCHLAIFAVMAWFSFGKPPREDPSLVMTVRLGGPPNAQLSGQKRKAPVAGVTKNRKVEKPAETQTKPKRNKPKPKANEVGLKKKQPNKPKPKKPTAGSDRPNRSKRKSTPDPAPETVKDKGARAIGGLDGSKGTGVSLEVGDGSEVVDTKDIEFISYFRTVQAEISSRWIKRGLEGGTTRVRFFIGREGKVSNVEVVRSSGKSYLDGPAVRAVMGSEFPPLPQGYKGERLILNINFQYGDKP